jgi:hypothetical protein
MKQIKKQIEVTRYVSFDGREFETEQECLNYEGSCFGILMKQLENAIPVKCDNCPDGFLAYFLVPKTRHEIFILDQIMRLVGKDGNLGDVYEHPIVLCVSLKCNVVEFASVTKLDERIEEITGSMFKVVANVIKNEKK